MRLALALLALLVSCPLPAAPLGAADRFVWVFGWNLGNDQAAAEVCKVIETGADHGLNGAVVSLGLDSLCLKDQAFLGRVEKVRQLCERRGIELIPAVFSIGYGGGILGHDRNLAEGFPVQDAPFVVRGGEARLVADPSIRLDNGDFEAHDGNRFRGYRFHDNPGVVSFADTEIRHAGSCSIRFENFGANPHGHGRIMQEISVRPRRCYRIKMWVRTDGLEPTGGFALQVHGGKRTIAPRQFKLPARSDWVLLTSVFNSLTFDRIRIYAGIWGGKAGRFWIDDWSIEEVGPVNVLSRRGTPFAVKSEDGETTFEEGRDYAPISSKGSPYRLDGEAPPLRITPGGAIKDGQSIKVSWYHPMVINESQITVCMGEPALNEIFEHEAQLLARHVRPRSVFLVMDEVRMGGSCEACRGKDMARLLGQCAVAQVNAMRRSIPGARVYLWSDMFDPAHNAHGDYYLVEGDFTGSWQYLPKDIVIAVWGGKARPESLRFFSDKGFETLAACYYDADNLNDVREWLRLSREIPKVRGLMYTPWQKKYGLLPEFAELFREPR